MGMRPIAAGMAPDLRASPILLDQQAFYSIVRDGALVSRAPCLLIHDIT